MFYSKPLASLPLTEFSPSSSPISLGFSLSLSLSFPFSTTVNTEQARARHVSRHNHRALSGMIKFSTARLTEFPFSQEKSCERREREREREREAKREGKIYREKRSVAFIIAVTTDFSLSRPNFAFDDTAGCVKPDFHRFPSLFAGIGCPWNSFNLIDTDNSWENLYSSSRLFPLFFDAICIYLKYVILDVQLL